MKTSPFTASLAPGTSKIAGGFGAGGAINPAKFADELFKGVIPGPWLCCYMLRRFGWPNSGSDPYKNLCSWTLTTPMRGLFLCVTPYLGRSNLHFSVRFTKEVGDQIMSDPGREAFLARRDKVIVKWWNTTGRKLYSIGGWTKDGDEDELVYPYAEQEGKVYGLWRRKPNHKGINDVPKKDGYFAWWLARFLKEKHPEVKIPKMSQRERKARTSRFHIQARSAIKATMRDLLRPTNVRDISFTPFGDIERDASAIERYAKQKEAGYFEGAGYSAAGWFGRKLNDSVGR